EYYARAASLIHTTVDGKADAPLPDNVRVYTFAGSGHGAGPFPPVYGTAPEQKGQQRFNPNDFRWSHRALLLALDRWVANGTQPPASRYPRIDEGSLTPLSSVAFPRVPGVNVPERLFDAYRLDYGPQFHEGILSVEPPRLGKPFPTLVPQVDEDGNE